MSRIIYNAEPKQKWKGKKKKNVRRLLRNSKWTARADDHTFGEEDLQQQFIVDADELANSSRCPVWSFQNTPAINV